MTHQSSLNPTLEGEREHSDHLLHPLGVNNELAISLDDQEG